MATISERSAREAWDNLRAAYTGEEDIDISWPPSPATFKIVHRRCAMATHPDRGGNAAQFAQVDRAKCIVERWLAQPAPVAAPIHKKQPCDYCGGSGHVTRPSRLPGGKGLRQTCPKCSGSGDADFDTR